MSLKDHQETVDEFYDRIYVNFLHCIVFVYPIKLNEGTPQKWTLSQAREYVKYLEFLEKKVNEILI